MRNKPLLSMKTPSPKSKGAREKLSETRRSPLLPFSRKRVQMLFDELEELRNIAKVIGIQFRKVFLGSSFYKDQIAAAFAVGTFLFEVSRKSRYRVERRKFESLLIRNEINEIVVGDIPIRIVREKVDGVTGGFKRFLCLNGVRQLWPPVGETSNGARINFSLFFQLGDKQSRLLEKPSSRVIDLIELQSAFHSHIVHLHRRRPSMLKHRPQLNLNK